MVTLREHLDDWARASTGRRALAATVAAIADAATELAETVALGPLAGELGAVLSDSAFSIVVPILEQLAGWSSPQIREVFEAEIAEKLAAEGAPIARKVLDLAFKESMALYSELSAKNPNWKKVYDDYSAFRRDANLWFRFTEAGFDDFMQSQKF